MLKIRSFVSVTETVDTNINASERVRKNDMKIYDSKYLEQLVIILEAIYHHRSCFSKENKL